MVKTRLFPRFYTALVINLCIFKQNTVQTGPSKAYDVPGETLELAWQAEMFILWRKSEENILILVDVSCAKKPMAFLE